jgi:hypothetical protein
MRNRHQEVGMLFVEEKKKKKKIEPRRRRLNQGKNKQDY